MMACIALLEAFKTNKEFQPSGLYFAAFFIDASIVGYIIQ
jgi:hypothetical protein